MILSLPYKKAATPFTRRDREAYSIFLKVMNTQCFESERVVPAQSEEIILQSLALRRYQLLSSPFQGASEGRGALLG